jgi:hypothetical protein
MDNNTGNTGRANREKKPVERMNITAARTQKIKRDKSLSFTKKSSPNIKESTSLPKSYSDKNVSRKKPKTLGRSRFRASRVKDKETKEKLPETKEAIMELAHKVTYQPIPQIKPVHTITDLVNLGATQAFMWLYKIPPKLKIEDRFGNRTEFENARDWWERATPIQQCTNIIGEWKSTDQDKCYICGLPFNADNIPQRGGGPPTKKQKVEAKKESYNTPECEHILPVLEGCLFLTLYQSEHKDTSREAIRKQMQLEYDWAHRCCNRVKSDSSFMKMGKDKNGSPIFVFDYKNTKSILNAIYTSNASYCTSHLKSKFPKDKETWINQRADIIHATKIQPICNYLNKTLRENYKLFYLSILASLISSADHMHIHYAQQDYTKARKIPAIESIPKTIIYDTISRMVGGKIYSITNTPGNGGIKFNQNSNEIIHMIMSICNPAHNVKLIIVNKTIYDNIKSYILSVLTEGSFLPKNIKPTHDSTNLFRILFLLLSSAGPQQGQMPLISQSNMAAEIAIEFMYIFYYSCLLGNLKMYKNADTNAVKILKKELEGFFINEIKESITNIQKKIPVNIDAVFGIFLILTDSFMISRELNSAKINIPNNYDPALFEKYMHPEHINNLLNGFVQTYSTAADEIQPPVDAEQPNDLYLLSEAIEMQQAAKALESMEDIYASEILMSMKNAKITKEEEDTTITKLNQVIDRYSLDESVLKSDIREIVINPTNEGIIENIPRKVSDIVVMEETPEYIKEEADDQSEEMETSLSRALSVNNMKSSLIRSLSNKNNMRSPPFIYRSSSMPIGMRVGGSGKKYK